MSTLFLDNKVYPAINKNPLQQLNDAKQFHIWNSEKKSNISLWTERWFLSSNAKDIGTLYLIFALFSGLIGTAFSVLIRLELSGTGVQYIANNNLYNSIITYHAIVMTNLVSPNWNCNNNSTRIVIAFSPFLGRVYNNNNKRSFTNSIKVHSPFLDWPHINDIITNINTRMVRGEILWECDYSLLTSAILPYYFHNTENSTWVITPEYNHLEQNHPYYTIFSITRNPYNPEIHVVVEIKSKLGNSWYKLLNQMWDQADVAK